MRIIFHLDLDAFFVSVERVLEPSLNGKPVIVGGDPLGRGVVTACSYEARKYGLHSAMPIRQAYKLCPHGIYLHGHFKEYENYSKAVENILKKYAPILQQASIDEFYMDFTGCEKIYGNFFLFASFLQKEIWDQLLLPSSIGIGSNKTIAKIASDCMKPLGITYVLPGMEKDFLCPMPVETIPGVGKVTLKSLREKGFRTIGEVAKTTLEYFSTAYGKSGIDLWEKANGHGTDFLSISHERKSISKETTFDEDVVSKIVIEQTLFKLIGTVCQTLRDENWQAATISIKLRYSDFVTITRAKTIRPTDDDKLIYETTLDLFHKAFTRRIAVRLIGVHLSNLTDFAEQEILFEDEEIKRKKMLKAINTLRAKYGFKAVQVGTAT
ncbi:MAG: DNA polymerase IV [Ignavibacteriales bacterium]|nr:DNA polymerase IV [Ignavibacteriales bacterium]